MLIPRRKLLFGGGAAMGAALAAQRAEADTAFPNYAFTATGSTSPRTMPDRLAEEKNVLNYSGIDPTGNAANAVACTAAIQAAVDDARSAGSGVFFPPGTYSVTGGSGSAILLNDDVDFSFYMRGAGGQTSTIVSNTCPGYLVDRSLGTPNNTLGPRSFENLGFYNGTTSPSRGGGLRIGSSIGVIVRDCNFGAAGIGFTTEDSPGNSSQAIVIEACTFSGSSANLTSVGYVLGGSGVVSSTNAEGTGVGSIIYGKGISINASRCERCDTAFKLGVDSGGTDRGLNGFSLVSQEMEGVVTFIDFIGTVKGFTIGSLGILGHDIGNSGLDGFTVGSQYGIRIRANTAYFGEFVVVGVSSYFDVGCIYMEDYTTDKRSFVTFSNCWPSVADGAGVPWRIPSASAWPLFINNLSIDASTGPPTGLRYLYAGLPTGGDVFEGDEFDISDATTSTIGATVTTGGGSNRIHVRYNGTNWICLPG